MMRALARLALLSLPLSLLLAASVESQESIAQDEQRLRQELRLRAPEWYDRERDAWKPIYPRTDKSSTTLSSNHSTMSFEGIGALVTVMAWILVIALIGGLIVVLIVALRRLSPRRAEPSDNRTRVATATVRVIGHLRLDPNDAVNPEQAARTAYETGDWRASVVWSYALMLIAMDAAGRIRMTPGITDRTCLRLARAADDRDRAQRGSARAASDCLELVLGRYERICFAAAPAMREDAEVAVRELDALRTSLSAAQPAKAQP